MEALRQLTTESERSCLFGHSEFNLGSVGSSDFVRLNPGPYLSTSRWRDTVGKGEGGPGGGFADNDSATGAKWMNVARKDKGSNKLDI